MAHFYERIKNRVVKYEEEISKLTNMLYNNDSSFFMESFVKIIDNGCFKTMKLCGNYLSFESMLSDVYGIDIISDRFICLSELILSLNEQILFSQVAGLAERSFVKSQLSGMKNLILYDLEKLNLSVEIIEDDIGRVASIGPKNALLEEVLENVTDRNIETMLIKYNSSLNNGDVNTKENILCAIYSYVESYLKNPQLLALNKRLFGNVDFLYNNLNMKHDNKVYNETFFYEETLSEREKWLDNLYHLVLMVIASKKENDTNQSINELKVKKKNDSATSD